MFDAPSTLGRRLQKFHRCFKVWKNQAESFQCLENNRLAVSSGFQGLENYLRGRSSGPLVGRRDSPMRNSSTQRAASRPSEIAQTINDCPRWQSPAAKTLSTEVWWFVSVLMFPRSSSSTPRPWMTLSRSGPGWNALTDE